ncbi:MAG: hypothetical protein ABIA04_06290 [Pseudomonadota bacterium]
MKNIILITIFCLLIGCTSEGYREFLQNANGNEDQSDSELDFDKDFSLMEFETRSSTFSESSFLLNKENFDIYSSEDVIFSKQKKAEPEIRTTRKHAGYYLSDQKYENSYKFKEADFYSDMLTCSDVHDEESVITKLSIEEISSGKFNKANMSCSTFDFEDGSINNNQELSSDYFFNMNNSGDNYYSEFPDGYVTAIKFFFSYTGIVDFQLMGTSAERVLGQNTHNDSGYLATGRGVDYRSTYYTPTCALGSVMTGLQFGYRTNNNSTKANITEIYWECTFLGYAGTRIRVSDTKEFPFNTIARVHKEHFAGTASLISPYAALTNAHVVYSRGNGKYHTELLIKPAMTKVGNYLLNPYGVRTSLYSKTNDKWVDSETNAEEVDYGALLFACAFEEISTYMPLVFDSDPNYIHLSGYPVEEVSDEYYQYYSEGDVIIKEERLIYYNAVSSGGASGSPVWLEQNRTKQRIVAVNRGSNDIHGGQGVRLTWQNEDLILSWMEWQPTFAEKLSQDCPQKPVHITNWEELKKLFVTTHKDKLISSDDLKLGKLSDTSGATSHVKVAQYIENNLYVWEEYTFKNNDNDDKIFVKMLKPEKKILETEEARVLLSASRQWIDQKPSGEHALLEEIDEKEEFKAFQVQMNYGFLSKSLEKDSLIDEEAD